jgi:hypothetical protein
VYYCYGMAKRYELRIDSDEYATMKQRAAAAGIGNVAEYLRRLAREDARRADDRIIVDLAARAVPPKVR